MAGAICFITGPEGSGTTALVRALTNHPAAAKGDAARYGHPALHAAAGAQLIDAALMCSDRAGTIRLADAARARQQLHAASAALFAAQPAARALFFKYSTPAFRPKRWPVFVPLFEVPEFRVLIIWRRPIDAIYSAFRRFYQGGHPGRDFLAAAHAYASATRHIRRQLSDSPADRYLTLRYEALVARPEPVLREVCAFAELDYRSAEELLPGRGFSDEGGKWKHALRSALTSRRT